MIQMQCEQCTEIFSARKMSAKYCSAGCRQKAWRIKTGKQVEKSNRVKITGERCSCLHCKDGFLQSGKGRNAKFCSNSCRTMAHRAKLTAIENMKTKFQRMDYSMRDVNEVLAMGIDKFDEMAKRADYEYSYELRCYVYARNHRSFAETCEMFTNHA